MNFESKVEACSIKKIPIIKGRMSWFMAIMVAMFYSQHSRAILSTFIDNLNLENANLKKFFVNLFHQKFEQGFTDTDILKLLYETNREIFMIEPINDIWAFGIDPLIYIGGLYDLLNIKYRMFEFNENTKDSLIYSLFNKEYNQHVSKNFDITNKFLSFEMKKNSKFMSRFNPEYDNLTEDKPDFSDIPAPPILIVRAIGKIPNGHYDADRQYYIERTYNHRVKVEGESDIYGDANYLLNRVNDANIRDNITSMKEKIMYMGEYYVLDSVILYKDLRGGEHQVVGITCNKKKYVYNALTYKDIGDNLFYTESEKPIKENWDINKRASWDDIAKESKSTTKLLKVLSINEDNNDYYENDGHQFPYNFKEGIRTLIYVKINNNLFGGLSLKKNLKLKKPTKSSKKPHEGKVLNPKTGRYILIKNKPSSEKIPTKKSAKKPPEGKVLNPKTGRYILIKNKPSSEKIPTKKSAKKPPEGKVLNHKK